MVDASALGQFILSTRTSKGMTQNEVAAHLGVVPNTVWRWENGYRLPRPHDLRRLAQVLGWTDEQSREAAARALGLSAAA